jgi:uncharacterized protein
MITEMVTGLVAGVVHGEFENVEWKLRPMNETTKLVILVAITGMLATSISVTAVYKVLQLHKFWVKFYVTVLLIVMGVCSVLTAKTYLKYRPNLMWIFAFVGGFNKGVGRRRLWACDHRGRPAFRRARKKHGGSHLSR